MAVGREEAGRKWRRRGLLLSHFHKSHATLGSWEMGWIEEEEEGVVAHSQDILVGREEKTPFSKSSQQKGEIDQPYHRHT